MSFKNKATQKGFYEWWDKDYIQQFVEEYRGNETVKWLSQLAFEAGIQHTLSILQASMSPLAETTTENLE